MPTFRENLGIFEVQAFKACFSKSAISKIPGYLRNGGLELIGFESLNWGNAYVSKILKYFRNVRIFQVQALKPAFSSRPFPKIPGIFETAVLLGFRTCKNAYVSKLLRCF